MDKLMMFIQKGISALTVASRGQYSSCTPSVKELKDEIFSRDSSLRRDRNNLAGDSRKVSDDIGRAYNKLISQNG